MKKTIASKFLSIVSRMIVKAKRAITKTNWAKFRPILGNVYSLKQVT